MTNSDRDTMRDLQDQLIALVEKHGICEDLQITQEYAGAPTARELRYTIRPEYKAAIEYAIAYIYREYE